MWGYHRSARDRRDTWALPILILSLLRNLLMVQTGACLGGGGIEKCCLCFGVYGDKISALGHSRLLLPAKLSILKL